MSKQRVRTPPRMPRSPKSSRSDTSSISNDFDFFSIFDVCLDENVERRRIAVNDVVNAFKLALEMPGASIDHIQSDTCRQALSTRGRSFLDMFLPTIMRMCYACPVADIRESFKELVEYLRDRNVTLPPVHTVSTSRFVSQKDVTPVGEIGDYRTLAEESADDPKECEARNRELVVDVFTHCFFQSGMVGHLEQLIAWHPTFLHKWHNTMEHMMYNEGAPLPDHWRHFIAVMGASRYYCHYLIRRKRLELCGGGDADTEWTSIGVSAAPPKLQALCELNSKLAHQPWTISVEDIATLVTEWNWTLGEVVHAMLILTSFYATSGLVHGLGVNAEADDSMVWLSTDQSGMTTEDDEDGGIKQEHTQQLLRMLQDRMSQDPRSVARTVHDKDGSVESFEMAGTNDDTKLDITENIMDPECEKYGCMKEFPTVYVDFEVRSKVYKVLREHEFNWSDQGVALVNYFIPEAGTLLESELDEIYNLTYNKVNTIEGVDTKPFRQALWFYALRLYGLYYDDYEYHDVNIYLNKSIKSFIKKVACHPQSMTFSDFKGIEFSFSPQEKCHIALLASEAHRQASLVYGLHAVNKFQKLQQR